MGLRNHLAAENHFRSQRRDFTAKGHFRSHFVAKCHFRSQGEFLSHFAAANGVGGLRNGTRVPRGGFAAVKPPAKWGCDCENVILRRGGFRSRFVAAKWGYGAAKWHSCAKGVFQSCENFCSQGPFSQGALLGCKISQTILFLCF